MKKTDVNHINQSVMTQDDRVDILEGIAKSYLMELSHALYLAKESIITGATQTNESPVMLEVKARNLQARINDLIRKLEGIGVLQSKDAGGEMKNKALICECQDSHGKACGKSMTIEEFKQDGICWDCADRVWDEMNTKGNTKWRHSTTDNEKMQGAKPHIKA